MGSQSMELMRYLVKSKKNYILYPDLFSSKPLCHSPNRSEVTGIYLT